MTRLFAAIALILSVSAPARADDAPTAAGLWRELLATGATLTLPSANENGYRLNVIIAKPTDVAGLRVARITYEWSEIDTDRDVPGWKRAKKIAARPGLPAQVIVADAGVYWRATPADAKALKKLGKTKPTFTVPPVGMSQRPLKQGISWCFSDPAARLRKAETRVELCLAPGHGLVAAKGVVPPLAEIVFAQPGWIASD